MTFDRDARPTEWTWVQAFHSEGVCAKAAAAKIKLLSEEDGTEFRANVINKTYPSGYLQSNITRGTSILCVPDTVDPRGPKGK